MSGPLLNPTTLSEIIARALADAAWQQLRGVVKVASNAFPSANDSRLGGANAALSPFVKEDLKLARFSIDPASGDRINVHILLMDFGVGKADLTEGHRRILSMLHVPMFLGNDFRIERVIGGASQTGPEGSGGTGPGNEALASERAAVATSWLVFNLGLKPADVHAVSYGSKRPLIDRTGHPDGLEEPFNRNVIITYSLKLRKVKEAPEPVKIPVPKTLCENGGSPFWSMDQVGEIAFDGTAPIAGQFGGGGGIALRLFKLNKLDKAQKTLETREFLAIGAGMVFDYDPVGFSKEAEQLEEGLSTLRKVFKQSSLSGMMTTLPIWSEPLNRYSSWFSYQHCINFSDFDGTVLTTVNAGGAGFGQGVSGEFASFPILSRRTFGVSHDTGAAVLPSAALKLQVWYFFEKPK